MVDFFPDRRPARCERPLDLRPRRRAARGNGDARESIRAGNEENGAERAVSQRQSRARGRDGAFLSELRGDRERKDPDQNVQRRKTRAAAPDAECLLRGLWQRAFPGEMRPMANPPATRVRLRRTQRSAGLPCLLAPRAPECQRPAQRLERPGGANPGHEEQRRAARPAPQMGGLGA